MLLYSFVGLKYVRARGVHTTASCAAKLTRRCAIEHRLLTSALLRVRGRVRVCGGAVRARAVRCARQLSCRRRCDLRRQGKQTAPRNVRVSSADADVIVLRVRCGHDDAPRQHTSTAASASRRITSTSRRQKEKATTTV
eukprot:1079671-Prorocentrum_minimum.AAC.1